jgi:hypothetical protein
MPVEIITEQLVNFACRLGPDLQCTCIALEPGEFYDLLTEQGIEAWNTQVFIQTPYGPMRVIHLRNL